MAEFNLFDREAEFLIADVLGNSSYESTASALGEIARLIDSYDREDINTFLTLYTPRNGEKFSSAELIEGTDKISRYLDMLEEESLELERAQTGIYNQIEYEKANLRSLVEGAVNKLNALRIYSRVGFSTFSFLATASNEWLSSTEEGRKRLVVSDSSNGAVLPIASQVQLPIKGIKLGAKSNGSPGDPRNLDRVFQRDSLGSVIDSNPITYFEYSRAGEDGVRLELEIELNDISIVNAITFDIVEYPFTHQAQLVEAYYELSSGQWASWISAPESLSGERIVYLNPVKTKNLRLVLGSLGADTIRTGFNLFSRRSILGIKDILIHSISYEPKGQLISKRREAKASTVSLSDVSVLPTVDTLFTYRVFAKDRSDMWKELELLATNTNDFVNGSAAQIKINVDLVPSAFSATDSALATSSKISNFENFNVTNSNPNQFGITELFLPNSIGAIEWEPYTVGTDWFELTSFSSDTSDSGPMYRLPLLQEAELKHVRVFANGRELIRANSPTSVDQYTIGKQGEVSFVRLGPGSPSVKVHAWLAPETLNFKRLGSMFVATLRHSVVPIKDYVNLEHITSIEGSAIQLFQPDTDLLELDHKLVSGVELQVGRDLLTSAGYTQVNASPSNPRSAFTGPNQYYVNELLGLIYLSENSSQHLFVSYKFKDIRSTASYEIWKTNNNVPQAIAISPSRLVTYDVQEVLSSTTRRVAKAKLDSGSEPQYFSSLYTYDVTTNIAYLSHGHVVEGSVELLESAFTSVPVEAPYIDGRREFASGAYGRVNLGPGVESGGLTSWHINDYAFIDVSLGVYPVDTSVFVTQKPTGDTLSNPGDWSYNVATGALAVNAISLGPDMVIGYWFRDFDSSQHMYSVDYEFGRVFFSEPIATPTTVKYKVAPYRVSYRPGRAIQDYTIDGEFVKIRSSLLNPGQNLTIFYDTLAINSNIEELRNYYSPILKSINLDIV